ncbi:MAG: HDOD domain-containing protein [Opitutaceae bacterium]
MSIDSILRVRYTEAEIKRRIDACPKLASLKSINRTLKDLVRSDTSLNSQIAAVIRRDPSLAARILRLVNSVYFGLSTKINNIEEAVFFLGLRQIRELSIATPVLEELEHLESKTSNLPWRALWSHSIATAILTREILGSTSFNVDDDTDYLIGLLHNIGKIVMAYSFPEELQMVMAMSASSPEHVCVFERAVIGWDHAQIGAHFLARHQLAEEITFATRYHNEPGRAPRHQSLAAAVQVADYLARHSKIEGGFETVAPITDDAWLQLEGWKILYGREGQETSLARASLANLLHRLPLTMNGLV